MEVELKFRLPSREVHEKVTTLLHSSHVETHLQENVFFDGANQELSSSRVTLRLRFYNDSKCVVTLKGKSVLADGVSRSTEEEEELDYETGRALVADPSLMASLTTSPLLSRVRSSFSISSFLCLGSFRNVRLVFSWAGYKLEVDETQFPFGTQYEIECETDKPEELKPRLEEFLSSNGIPFKYSTISKFATFRRGVLDPY